METPPFGLGGNSRPPDPRDLILGSLPAPIVAPATFIQDLSGISVKNQGTYGSCGGHGGAMLNSALYMQDLSPKYLWKTIAKLDGITEDVGTDMGSIMKCLSTTGDCLESLLPDVLDPTFQEYSDASVITPTETGDAETRQIGLYGFDTPTTWAQLCQLIFQHKGLLALVKCGTGWWTAPDGTASWAESAILPLQLGTPVDGHFIFLHSYDEKYIFFRNSWSAQWGRAGDGYFDQTYFPHIIELGTAVAAPGTHFHYVFTKQLTYEVASNDPVELKALQQALQYLKSKATGQPYMTPGVFGAFGPQTAAALALFETDHGVVDPVPGHNFGPLNRQAMNIALAG